jgi:hypothetical protein
MLHDGVAFRLQSAGFTPTELDTEAAISIEHDKEGFRITCSVIVVDHNGKIARLRARESRLSRVVR